METIFLDIFKVSPILGLVAIMWFYQRKAYTKLVEDTRADSNNREERLQNTIDKNQEIIHKNQEIISELADKFDVVEDIQKDVAEIKIKLQKWISAVALTTTLITIEYRSKTSILLYYRIGEN